MSLQSNLDHSKRYRLCVFSLSYISYLYPSLLYLTLHHLYTLTHSLRILHTSFLRRKTNQINLKKKSAQRYNNTHLYCKYNLSHSYRHFKRAFFEALQYCYIPCTLARDTKQHRGKFIYVFYTLQVCVFPNMYVYAYECIQDVQERRRNQTLFHVAQLIEICN